MLNEKREFEKVLSLFDGCSEKQDQLSFSMVITQVLKACARMQNLLRGMKIHHSIASEIRGNTYLRISHSFLQ